MYPHFLIFLSFMHSNKYSNYAGSQKQLIDWKHAHPRLTPAGMCGGGEGVKAPLCCVMPPKGYPST